MNMNANNEVKENNGRIQLTYKNPVNKCTLKRVQKYKIASTSLPCPALFFPSRLLFAPFLCPSCGKIPLLFGVDLWSVDLRFEAKWEKRNENIIMCVVRVYRNQLVNFCYARGHKILTNHPVGSQTVQIVYVRCIEITENRIRLKSVKQKDENHYCGVSTIEPKIGGRSEIKASICQVHPFTSENLFFFLFSLSLLCFSFLFCRFPTFIQQFCHQDQRALVPFTDPKETNKNRKKEKRLNELRFCWHCEFVKIYCDWVSLSLSTSLSVCIHQCYFPFYFVIRLVSYHH